MSDAAANRGTIVVLNRDLFFGVKIGNTLRALGYTVTFAKETAAFLDAVKQAGPALALIDMGVGVDWPLVAAYTAAPGASPVLVFGSHLDVDGRRAAKSAGVVRVLSNGDFHRDMVGFIQRYATGPGHARPEADDADDSDQEPTS